MDNLSDNIKRDILDNVGIKYRLCNIGINSKKIAVVYRLEKVVKEGKGYKFSVKYDMAIYLGKENRIENVEVVDLDYGQVALVGKEYDLSKVEKTYNEKYDSIKF